MKKNTLLITMIIMVLMLTSCKPEESISYGTPFKMNEDFAAILEDRDATSMMHVIDDKEVLFFINDIWYIYDVSKDTYDRVEMNDYDEIIGVRNGVLYLRQEDTLHIYSVHGELLLEYTVGSNFHLQYLPDGVLLMMYNQYVSNDDTGIIILNDQHEVVFRDDDMARIVNNWSSDFLAYKDDTVYVLEGMTFTTLFDLEHPNSARYCKTPSGYVIDILSFNPTLQQYEEVGLKVFDGTQLHTIPLTENLTHQSCLRIDHVGVHEKKDNNTRLYHIYSLDGTLLQTFDITDAVTYNIIDEDTFMIQRLTNEFTFYNITGDEIDLIRFDDSYSTNITLVDDNTYVIRRGGSEPDYVYDGTLQQLDYLNFTGRMSDVVYYKLQGEEDIHVIEPGKGHRIISNQDINNDWTSDIDVDQWSDIGLFVVTDSGYLLYSLEGTFRYEITIILRQTTVTNSIYLAQTIDGEYVFLT